MVVWLRIAAVLFLVLSALGFLNALYFRNHGPGADLGAVAAVLSVAAWSAARWEQKNDV